MIPATVNVQLDILASDGPVQVLKWQIFFFFLLNIGPSDIFKFHIQILMSVPLEHITAVLMPCATIPKDHTTAHVNRDFLEMDKCAQVNLAISLVIQVNTFLKKSERVHEEKLTRRARNHRISIIIDSAPLEMSVTCPARLNFSFFCFGSGWVVGAHV